MRRETLKKKLKFNKVCVIVLGVIIALLSILIIFNKHMNIWLNLQPNLYEISDNSLEIHFVDTGEGDCILIRLPNDKTMIIDSGIVSHRANIIKYIDNVFFSQDKVFDYALLTHSDIDHSGNFNYILNNYTVKNFYRPSIYSKNIDEYKSSDFVIDNRNYDDLLSTLNLLQDARKTKVMFASVGAETDEIKDYIKFLSPISTSYDDENEYSPFLLVSYGGHSVLLTGDATIENEIELINTYDELDVDVLKLGHHGSNTSTSYDFLEYTSPEYYVISYGANTFGHPSDRVLDDIGRYDSNYSDKMFTTYAKGNIVCELDDTINFYFVDDVNNYLFVEYYFIAICLVVICLLWLTFSIRFIIKHRYI